MPVFTPHLAVLASLACIAGSFEAPRITVVNPTGSIGFAALKQLKERTDGASQVRALLFNDAEERRAREQWLSKCICRDGEVRNLCELTFPALKFHRCVVGTETNGVLLNARPAELLELRRRKRDEYRKAIEGSRALILFADHPSETGWDGHRTTTPHACSIIDVAAATAANDVEHVVLHTFRARGSVHTSTTERHLRNSGLKFTIITTPLRYSRADDDVDRRAARHCADAALAFRLASPLLCDGGSGVDQIRTSTNQPLVIRAGALPDRSLRRVAIG